MLTDEELDRVCVVLVRARNPSNIGAVARAMHDFGFGRLRVVNEFALPFEAAKSAVDASAVMGGAERYASVAEAVGDCTLVVGTTAVGERDLQHKLLTLAEAGPRMIAEVRGGPTHRGETAMNGAHTPADKGSHDLSGSPTHRGETAMNGAHTPADKVSHDSSGSPTHRGETAMNGAQDVGTGSAAGRVALVFGSEKTGLSNEELSHCHWLLTIPMREYEGVRHPSMNLGQAVAVCLYELVRDPTHDGETVMNGAPHVAAGHDVETVMHGAPDVTAGQMERITALLMEVLEETEYTRRHAANSDPAMMRRLVRRMGLDEADAVVWLGILRQVLWRLRRE
jgi:tRNA C32,U32 (ribose-2'-O)-methylase TrmJ